MPANFGSLSPRRAACHCQVVATHAYAGADSDELAFAVGDVIDVIKYDDLENEQVRGQRAEGGGQRSRGARYGDGRSVGEFTDAIRWRVKCRWVYGGREGGREDKWTDGQMDGRERHG